MTDPDLNKIEMWIAEHSIRIFLVIAALLCVGAFFAVKASVRSVETAREVDVLKPQVTKIVHAAATCSAQTIKEKRTSNACAARLRFALVVCRRSARCRAALLAIVNYPPPAKSTSPSNTTATAPSKGVMPQQPSSHGHQQPGPSGGQHHEGGQGAAPTPSPAPSPAPSGPPAHEPGPPAETPGKGPPGGTPPGQEGKSPSGVGVEVCALERTCVGVEADLPPKGLLP